MHCFGRLRAPRLATTAWRIRIVQAVVELDELSVHFGEREILKNLRIALSGRIIGLLGPNGAGKSTLIQTLLGFCPASSGRAKIFGHDISRGSGQGPHAGRLHARKRLVDRGHDGGVVCADDGRIVRD